MTHPFRICESLASRYQALRYDDEAGLNWSILPIATVYWSDEHPDGRLVAMCHEECRDSILRLLAARISYWDNKEVAEDLETIWTEAKHRLPTWPGFRRLYLGAEQRKLQQECEEAQVEAFMSLFGGADDVSIEDKGGRMGRWSAKYDLRDRGDDTNDRDASA